MGAVSNPLRELLEARLAATGMSVDAMAARAGMVPNTFRRTMYGQRKNAPSSEVMGRLARGLGVEVGMVQAAVADAYGMVTQEFTNPKAKLIVAGVKLLPADQVDQVWALMEAMLDAEVGREGLQT